MNQEAAIPVDEAIEELPPRRWFRPYPEYRDSGVGGVHAVPAHWRGKPLKYLASANAEKLADTTDPDYELEYVDIGNVSPIDGVTSAESYSFEDAPSRARRRVRPGDTIISTVRTYLKAVARIDDPPDNLVVSTGFAVLHARPDLDPAYLYRLVQSDSFVERVVACSIGVSYPAINPSNLVGISVVVPPLAEQRAIAAFLDRETGRIDEVIARQQRLIELLAEKRTALISHAVTKGLNPDAPMKESGIDWLGKVPKHWSIKKLKFLADGGFENGLFKKKQFFGSGVRLVNVFDVYREDFVVDETTLERVEADGVETRRYAVQPGDIVFVRSSLKLEGVGKSACMLELSEPAVFECHLVRMRPSLNAILPHFLINFLNSIHATNRLIALANQVTMTTIDQDKFKSLEVPVPPRQEQKAITERLSEHTRRFFALTSSVREAIDKLHEYRSALISAAVTGKIDVREEVVG